MVGAPGRRLPTICMIKSDLWPGDWTHQDDTLTVHGLNSWASRESRGGHWSCLLWRGFGSSSGIGGSVTAWVTPGWSNRAVSLTGCTGVTVSFLGLYREPRCPSETACIKWLKLCRDLSAVWIPSVALRARTFWAPADIAPGSLSFIGWSATSVSAYVAVLLFFVNVGTFSQVLCPGAG